jgi:hypothetical protein
MKFKLEDHRRTFQSRAYGCLHDYVPFYFAPRSPMLYALLQGRVGGFNGSQEDIVYLVTRTDKIIDSGSKYDSLTAMLLC